jgi:DNA-binding MarR family transcriptional regulator/GNAT superfamily N-acetyltransferase
LIDSVNLLPDHRNFMHRPSERSPVAEIAPDRIAAVRRFNRFYTRRIGVLQEGLLQSDFSLTEVRVLFELAQRDGLTASDLADDLSLDPGYLSRILQRFARAGLVARRRSVTDARVHTLALTAKGRAAFAPLDRRSQREVADMLAALPDGAQARLLGAMNAIAALLDDAPPAPAACVLRLPRPGDMGWVVERHGTLYAQEYGWDEHFEGLVAEIVAQFVRTFDPERERCWIAERDGQRVGSVFVVRKSATVAKLRLLIVDPAARGAGLGRRMVDECVAFASRAGYRTLTLWTQSNLLAARHIYEASGFRRTHQEPHTSFSHPLVGETWSLALRKHAPTRGRQ